MGLCLKKRKHVSSGEGGAWESVLLFQEKCTPSHATNLHKLRPGNAVRVIRTWLVCGKQYALAHGGVTSTPGHVMAEQAALHVLYLKWATSPGGAGRRNFENWGGCVPEPHAIPGTDGAALGCCVRTFQNCARGFRNGIVASWNRDRTFWIHGSTFHNAQVQDE